MLWELSVTEERYRAVLEVRSGVLVTEVADQVQLGTQCALHCAAAVPGPQVRLGSQTVAFWAHPI